MPCVSTALFPFIPVGQLKKYLNCVTEVRDHPLKMSAFCRLGVKNLANLQMDCSKKLPIVREWGSKIVKNLPTSLMDGQGQA